MSIQTVGSTTLAPPSPNATPISKREGAAIQTPSTDGQTKKVENTSRSEAAPAAVDSASQTKLVTEAVDKIRQFVNPINDSIQFSIDEDSGRTVVKVVDLQTQEVIKQIPSEEALNLAKALDKLQGLLIQGKA